MINVTIDQTKIVIDAGLMARGAAPFPRPLAWWRKTLPIWVDADEVENGYIVLSPNGKVADGRVLELTPAAARRYRAQIIRYLSGRSFLDFSDAIVSD